MATAAVCITHALVSDPALLFSNLPADVIRVANQYTSPAMAITCRDAAGDEYVIHQPLDGVTRQRTQLIRRYSRCIYGFPVPYEWRQPTMTLTRRRLDGRRAPPDIVNVNYMEPDATRMYSAPEWAPLLQESTTDGPTVELTRDRVLLPLLDDGFWVFNKATTTAQRTTMVFGPRNPALGWVRLAARDYNVPGVALISGTGNHMLRYCAQTDSTEHIPLPQMTAHDRVSCILSMPGTSTFLVGMGSRLFIYDFRQSLHPAGGVDTLYPLWPSAAMFSDHGVASWNSLNLRLDGSWEQRRHCQTCDLRSPDKWLDRPEWNVPLGYTPLWIAPLAVTPRTL